MNKDKLYIGKMIMIQAICLVVVALVGVGLYMWFGDAAKPASRNIRTPADWAATFAVFYYSACGVSFVYTLVTTFLAAKCYMNKRINWIVNLLVPLIISIGLAVVFMMIAPSKTIECTVVAAIAIVLQSVIIFLPACFAQPGHWDSYCPFK